MFNRRKILTLIICVIFTVSILLSVVFIAEEANHHCTGQNCPICNEIQICFNMLNNVGTGLPFITPNVVRVYILLMGLAAVLIINVIKTLVQLKIKLTE